MLTGGEGAYALADDVSEEQFEQALCEAKADGNVSRANVVRKLKPEPAKPTERHELLRKTRHLNSDRIVNETVMAAAALDSSAIKHVIWDALDRDQLGTWLAQLDDAIRFLNRLRSNLKKEMTSEQDATGTEG